MITAKFLPKAFDQISNQFPQCVIKYQFDEPSLTHFVQVTPEEVFDEEAFGDLDIQLTLEFNNLCKDESFCIVTDDGLVKLNNLKLVYQPPYEHTIVIGERKVLSHELLKEESKYFVLPEFEFGLNTEEAQVIFIDERGSVDTLKYAA